MPTIQGPTSKDVAKGKKFPLKHKDAIKGSVSGADNNTSAKALQAIRAMKFASATGEATHKPGNRLMPKMTAKD